MARSWPKPSLLVRVVNLMRRSGLGLVWILAVVLRAALFIKRKQAYLQTKACKYTSKFDINPKYAAPVAFKVNTLKRKNGSANLIMPVIAYALNHSLTIRIFI